MSDPLALLDRLKQEWPVIMGAPLSFTIAVIIVSVIVYGLTRLYYKAIIAQKDEQLKTKDERLDGKEQVISEYRERLHLLPPKPSPYLRLTNAQLKCEAFVTVQKLRQFFTTAKNRSDRISSTHNVVFLDWNKSKEERERAQATFHREFSEFSTWLISEYNTQFKVDAVLIRDELRSRIADPIEYTGFGVIGHAYESLINLIDLEAVTTHLEGLAKQLS